MWDPENSLINQTHDPELHPHLQLAGWGFGAWSDRFLEAQKPLIYKRPIPAFYDDNAKSIIPSLGAHTVLGQVRASGYDSHVVLADEYCHPFSFEKTQWIIAHNGAIADWRLLQRDLLVHCQDAFLKQMRGSTDTEFLYVLLLSLLKGDSTDAFQEAFETALRLILKAMKSMDLVTPLKLKLTLVSAHKIMAANYGSGLKGETDIQGDWKAMRKAKVGSTENTLSMILEPMYYFVGKNYEMYDKSFRAESCADSEATTAILASEPLTDESQEWKNLEFGNMIAIEHREDRIITDCRVLSV